MSALVLTGESKNRMRFSVKGPGGNFRGRFSLYWFSRGRAFGQLIVMSAGAIPETLERRLATRIAERLKR
jgi:hypothetical protein